MSLSSISDRELHHKYVKRFTLSAGDILSSSDAVVKHLRAYFANEVDREKLVITYLNLSNALIGTEVLFTGTLSTSAVYPREVVKRVIKYHAAAIIIAHNHPSGNPEPSQDDKAITEKIKQVCSLINVNLHDHIILYRDGYTSFADKGLL